MYFLHSFTSFYSSALAGEGELLGHCMEMSGGAICLAECFYLSHGTNSFILWDEIIRLAGRIYSSRRASCNFHIPCFDVCKLASWLLWWGAFGSQTPGLDRAEACASGYWGVVSVRPGRMVSLHPVKPMNKAMWNGEGGRCKRNLYIKILISCWKQKTPITNFLAIEVFIKSGRRGSNPRPSAWKANALLRLPKAALSSATNWTTSFYDSYLSCWFALVLLRLNYQLNFDLDTKNVNNILIISFTVQYCTTKIMN